MHLIKRQLQHDDGPWLPTKPGISDGLLPINPNSSQQTTWIRISIFIPSASPQKCLQETDEKREILRKEQPRNPNAAPSSFQVWECMEDQQAVNFVRSRLPPQGSRKGLVPVLQELLGCGGSDFK